MAKKRSTPTAKEPSKSQLEEYFEQDKRRLALARKVRDIDKLQAEFEQQVLAYVAKNGGKKRCLVKHGYRLLIELCDGRVEWKTEFMRVAGQEEAEKLIQAATKRKAVKIEAPA